MHFCRYDYAAFGAMAVYAMCSVVIPVALLQLSRELGFGLEAGGMGWGGALQIGRSIPMTAALLFSGFVSARWGNRRAVGFSVLLMGLAIAVSAFSSTYALLFAALALAGLGEGTLEGLATPLVQDLHEKQPERYINFAHSFWPVGVLTAVIATGALLDAGVSWRWIVGGCGVLALFPALLLIAPSRRHPYAEHRVEKHWKTVCADAVTLFRLPRFWLYFVALFFAGGGEFGLTFWSATFIQVEYGGSPWAAGLGVGLFAVGMIVSRMTVGYFIREHLLRRLIIGCALAAALFSAFFPFLHSLTGLFVLLFLTGMSVGPFWPSLQSFAASRIAGDRTMIFILLSCAGIPGCGIFSALLGVLGDRFGLRGSFFAVTGCFLVIAALIGWDRLVYRRAGEKREL
jgi:MFS family permease